METIEERGERVEETDRRLRELGTLFQETEAQVRDMQQARSEVDQALRDLASFRRQSLELNEQAGRITARLADVDRVDERLNGLDRLAEDLENRAGELEPRLELVAALESRLNALADLNQRIDETIEGQMAKQGDLDAMRSAQKSLALQLADLQKVADALQSSKKIEDLESRLTQFETRLESSMGKIDRSESLGDSLVASEQRASDIDSRITQAVKRLDEQSARLETLQGDAKHALELHGELRIQAEQVDSQQQALEEQATSTRDLIAELQSLHGQIEARRRHLLEFEQKVGAYEGRIDAFEASISELDHKMDAVSTRHDLVSRLKRQVEEVFDTCERSRKEAAEVLSASKQVAATGAQLDEIATVAGDMSSKLGRLERKVGELEQTEFKIDSLHNLLDDIDVNLENFQEQRSVIDHLAEKLAKMDGEIRRAELATGALRDERQLAARIQDGIQSLKRRRPGERTFSLIRGEVIEGPQDLEPGIDVAAEPELRAEASESEPPA
jgi:chromosome segregation ATPase